MLETKTPGPLGSTTIIYLALSKYSIPLHKLVYARISELPTDRNFLDLSETCLYMVHFTLGIFSEKGLLKDKEHWFTVEEN